MQVMHAKLIAISKQVIPYYEYLFENLEPTSWKDEYVWTLRFPNWQEDELKEGDIGFLEFKDSIAQQSTWWDGKEKQSYKYTNIIFLKFIKDTEQD